MSDKEMQSGHSRVLSDWNSEMNMPIFAPLKDKLG